MTDSLHLLHNDNQEIIPIFLATDENYAPFASIMMKSVLMHTNSFVDFYVLDDEITDETKELIRQDLEKYKNKNLHFVNMRQFNLKRFPERKQWSNTMYGIYFIPQIAPELKKVIYLDVDIIAKKDIADLYHQDLENYALAAIPEIPNFYSTIIHKLPQFYPAFKSDTYFNSGVLLMDIPKLNQMDFINKASELTIKLNEKLEFPDQDVLNILFENNFKQLDASFNFMNVRILAFKMRYPQTPIDPYLIHYIGKAWNEPIVPFQQDYNEVLESSVFHQMLGKKYPKDPNRVQIDPPQVGKFKIYTKNIDGQFQITFVPESPVE